MLLVKACWTAWKIQQTVTRMIHGMEKPDLQRAVTEVHSIKFAKYKVKRDLGFGYNYQYKDSLSSISALSNLVVIIQNHCTASPNTLLKWCREP